MIAEPRLLSLAWLLVLVFPVAKGLSLLWAAGAYLACRLRGEGAVSASLYPGLVLVGLALLWGVIFSVEVERSLREALSILPALLGAWAVLRIARKPTAKTFGALQRALLLVVAVSVCGFLYWQWHAGPFIFREGGIQLFSTRNLYSGVLSFGFVAGVALVLAAGETHRQIRMPVAALCLLLGLLLVVHNTRGALLGAGVAFAVMLWLGGRARFLAGLVVGLLVVAGLLFLVFPDVHYRLGISRGGDFTSFRLMLWDVTWRLVQERPWTGYGIGIFKHAAEVNELLPANVRHQPSPHNWPLEWLLSLGVIGSALWLAGLVALWRGLRGVVALRHQSPLFGLFGAGLTTFVLVNGLVDFRAFGLFFLPVLFSGVALWATWERKVGHPGTVSGSESAQRGQ